MHRLQQQTQNAKRILRAAWVPNRSSATAAAAPIGDKLAKLKVSELNDIMRRCGIPLGIGKAHKIQSLSSFLQASQRLAIDRYQVHHKRQSPTATVANSWFVPREVVSIDIGFRNLAFAHVSSDGRVLAWKRVELLPEAVFEPWVLATAVEELVHNTLPVRLASQCTYIIEHQRFRSQGSAAVTNSVMVNNLVEALLYANLRHAGARIEAINPAQVSMHWKFPDTWDPLVESTSCVAKADSDNNQISNKSEPAKHKHDKKELLAETIVRMDQLLAEQKQTTHAQYIEILNALEANGKGKRASRAAGVRELAGLMQMSAKQLGALRDQRRRLLKKERAISLVQSWMLAPLICPADGSSSALQDPYRCPDEMWPFGDGSMKFTNEMCTMFITEKKKDDLCDCIIQAVAWYRWQLSVVDELNAMAATSHL
ncbi:hypothetical protein EV183_002372 [Coemansia sp. RSA 2336]|nr:hypothetical protein EV183_002372 [Coemansia sp. RSA 2336]